jgi:hypothetical protein
MESKRCYCCKRRFPLFMYHKATRFTIKSDLGRNRCCRICVFKAAKNPVVRWDSETKKFGIVKLNLKQRIKELLKN